MSEVAQAPHSSPDGHIPQLRFPEFNVSWNEYKLGSITDVVDSLHTTPKDYVSSGFPMIRVVDVSNIELDLNKCLNVSEETYRQFTKKYQPKVGDVVLSRVGTCGASIMLRTKDNVCLGQNTVLLHPKINKDFYHILVKSNIFQVQVSRRVVGSTQKTLSLKDLKLFKLNIPAKPEQQKIAEFLTAVDNKIEQLIKKQELLGEYKKGLMQQIFSQAIRFKADDGSDFPNWEEKKLGDVVSTPVSDGPHLTPKFVKQGVPFLSVNNLVESKIDFSNVRYISIDDHLVFSKKCKPKKGDVLLGKAASVGKVAFVETDVEFNIWSPIAMIRPGNSNFSKYIYYCFQTRFILNQISKFTNSSSQGNIGMGDINKIIIKLPNKLEQTKIANLLSSIDSKIEQVGKQLRESKQFKKALLQQMFV